MRLKMDRCRSLKFSERRSWWIQKHTCFKCFDTDHLYWKSGRVGLFEKIENLDFESRVGSVIWSVGGSVFFEVNFFKKECLKWHLLLAKMIFRQKALRSLAPVRILNVPVDQMSFFFYFKNLKFSKKMIIFLEINEIVIMMSKSTQ